MEECARFVSDGLSLVDILQTEATLVVTARALVAHPAKLFVEPPIKGYAMKDVRK
jgi:ABC-type molybdenum transport system ATPase subunit/photorepair protein PhrA